MPELRGVFPGMVEMKANTALGLVPAAASLSLLAPEGGPGRRAGRLLALAVAALGLLTLGEYLSGAGLGIDELLARDPRTPAGAHPGRMAPTTAANFVLAGLALLLLDAAPPRGGVLGELLALGVAVAALAVLIGHAYGAEPLYRLGQHTAVAVHTAAALLALALGILAARPERGLMALATARTAGGTVVRRQVPAVVLVLVLFGWLRTAGQDAGLYGTALGTALLVTASVLVLGGLVTATGRSLHRLDLCRREAEAVVRGGRQLYLATVTSIGDGVIATDAAGRVTLMNPVAETLTGWAQADAAGRPLGEVFRIIDEMTREPVEKPAEQALQATAPLWLANRIVLVSKDGVERPIDNRAAPIRDGASGVAGAVLVFRDVTSRRAIEDQLRQAQKLEAIGQLAGGVAHDFNNLLTVVNGCGELALADLPADAPARPLVEAVVAAGGRGASLTRQLLAFGRRQMLRAEVFDLSAAVPATAKLVGRLLGEDIQMILRLDPAAGSVRADLGQVEQIVINLAVNARDAMPAGGTLVIETAPAEVPEAAPRPSPDARPGRYVRLGVTDTGTGMTPEVKARLFEPFFTTKPAGKGTGLGLATVYGIVKQSGGFLTVQSEAGRGATFAVFLLRHGTVPDGPESAPRPEARAGGGETVLVVEDDETVRSLTTRILSRQGSRVVAAECGAAALALCERLPSPPDLLLTDVVMPGMSGRELAEALAARHPRLKAAFLSGYTGDDVLRHGVEEDRVAFLQKPYTPDALARLVRRVLDGSADE